MDDLRFFLVITGALVAAFAVIQLFTWTWTNPFGCARGFAIGTMTISLGASICLVVLGLTEKHGVPDLIIGLPFVLVYSISIFSVLLIPGLLIIEGIVVVELSTRRKESGSQLRQLHVAAALCCMAWLAVALLVRASK
jgi:hypothetical protein